MSRSSAKTRPPRFKSATGEWVNLSPGDALTVWRHRRGWTQRQAAKWHRVKYHQYSAWELDAETETACPGYPLGVLTEGERCLVHRRHSGLSQAAVATDLGVCVLTMRKMETGKAPARRLLEWWES